MLKSRSFLTLVGSCLLFVLAAAAQDAAKDSSSKDAGKDESKDTAPIIPKDSTTQGSVTVAGHTINYQAVAGTILVAATNDADASIWHEPAAARRPPKLRPPRACSTWLISRKTFRRNRAR